MKVTVQFAAEQFEDSVSAMDKGEPVDISRAGKRALGAGKALSAEVLFFGRHVYQSRVVGDGYTIDDVIDQIFSAMDVEALFIPTSKAAAIQNHSRRLDRYGNMVQDMAIFECTARHPRPELLSVIPKGDSPPKTKGR